MLLSTNPVVVWLKRDLRLTDHEPLANAIAQNRSLIVLYAFEPSLVADPHYDVRHWRFVWQSLEDINQQLVEVGGRLYIVYKEALEALIELHQQTQFDQLFSSEEIGIDLTFQRDKK